MTSNRRGYWIKQEHFFGKTTWKCSRCKAVFRDRETFCPKCHSENKKVRLDSVWVDELEMLDAFLDD